MACLSAVTVRQPKTE